MSVDTSQLDAFIARLGSWEAIARAPLEAALELSSGTIEEHARPEVPVFTGALQGDVQHQVQYPEAHIGNKAKEAPFVHGPMSGAGGRTRPHWPPSDALQEWADAHGIPVFVLARSIAQKGTPMIPYLRRGADASIGEIRSAFRAAVGTAVKFLVGG